MKGGELKVKRKGNEGRRVKGKEERGGREQSQMKRGKERKGGDSKLKRKGNEGRRVKGKE